MNKPYKPLALEIFGARMQRMINAIREDPKKSIRDANPEGRWGLYPANHKKLLAELTSAVHEGLDDCALHTTFLDRYALAEVNLLTTVLLTGHIGPDKLHGAYEDFKSYPGMADLSERDFYFFVSHILLDHIQKIRESI